MASQAATVAVAAPALTGSIFFPVSFACPGEAASSEEFAPPILKGGVAHSQKVSERTLDSLKLVIKTKAEVRFCPDRHEDYSGFSGECDWNIKCGYTEGPTAENVGRARLHADRCNRWYRLPFTHNFGSK